MKNDEQTLPGTMECPFCGGCPVPDDPCVGCLDTGEVTPEMIVDGFRARGRVQWVSHVHHNLCVLDGLTEKAQAVIAGHHFEQWWREFEPVIRAAFRAGATFERSSVHLLLRVDERRPIGQIMREATEQNDDT